MRDIIYYYSNLVYIVQDINQFYQIFPEEVLGSGQFGTVYAG